MCIKLALGPFHTAMLSGFSVTTGCVLPEPAFVAMLIGIIFMFIDYRNRPST